MNVRPKSGDFDSARPTPNMSSLQLQSMVSYWPGCTYWPFAPKDAFVVSAMTLFCSHSWEPEWIYFPLGGNGRDDSGLPNTTGSDRVRCSSARFPKHQAGTGNWSSGCCIQPPSR